MRTEMHGCNVVYSSEIETRICLQLKYAIYLQQLQANRCESKQTEVQGCNLKYFLLCFFEFEIGEDCIINQKTFNLVRSRFDLGLTTNLTSDNLKSQLQFWIKASCNHTIPGILTVISNWFGNSARLENSTVHSET